MTATLIGTVPVANRQADGKEFERVLCNITKARPRIPVDNWTEGDAAKFWLHDYDPADPNAVPPQIITAIVARLFAEHYRRVPPMARFIRSWLKRQEETHVGRPLSQRDRTIELEWHWVANVAHAGRTSHPPTDYAQYRNTGIEYLVHDSLGYCHRKTCKHRDSMLYGCLAESAYHKLMQAGYLVPWSSVNWGGFATLFTPVRNSVHSPVISVRKDRSHERKSVVPYWVADTFNNWHRIAPGLMMSHEFRSVVSRGLRPCVDAVFTERFRFSSMQSISPDHAEFMRRWDILWAIAAWDFVGTDNPYQHGSIDVAEELGVDAETLEKLEATCCSSHTLFGTVGGKSE